MKPKISEQLRDQLKRELEETTYLDVGHGAEEHYAVNKEQLRKAVNLLIEEGYNVRYIRYAPDTVCKILSKEPIPRERILEIRRDVLAKRNQK